MHMTAFIEFLTLSVQLFRRGSSEQAVAPAPVPAPEAAAIDLSVQYPHRFGPATPFVLSRIKKDHQQSAPTPAPAPAPAPASFKVFDAPRHLNDGYVLEPIGNNTLNAFQERHGPIEARLFSAHQFARIPGRQGYRSRLGTPLPHLPTRARDTSKRHHTRAPHPILTPVSETDRDARADGRDKALTIRQHDQKPSSTQLFSSSIADRIALFEDPHNNSLRLGTV
ncbi:MAG: hypothetical protein J3R72DRAFT_489808 [Linnemannia gamsii]|nr:MAG: hypothetical protein J3R72DRAFT_489808 [Linnemannia gamsii]